MGQERIGWAGGDGRAWGASRQPDTTGHSDFQLVISFNTTTTEQRDHYPRVTDEETEAWRLICPKMYGQ